jgi:YVTN family beta-propeller protein
VLDRLVAPLTTAAALIFGSVGCVDHPAPPAHEGGTDESGGTLPFPERFGVTADWRGGSISIVDIDALREATAGTTREDVVYATIELPDRPPGPIEVEIIPSTRRAIVSIGPGFFDGIVGNLIGAPNVPEGSGLLLVDLESGAVEAELERANAPMGIAIDPTGTTAYVANFSGGGDSISVIDLNGFTVTEDVVVGAGPEQIDLNADGTLGILNLAGDGTVRVFETADPSGTLSAPLEVSNDSSWVFFIDGTDFAAVANSNNDENYTVLDVSDPASPTIVVQGPEPGGVPYAGAPIPGTTEFLIVDTIVDRLGVTRVDVAGEPGAPVWSTVLEGFNSFPLGVAVDPQGDLAYIAAPGDNQLLVVDLSDESGESTVAIDWSQRVGPTYFALAPQ